MENNEPDWANPPDAQAPVPRIEATPEIGKLAAALAKAQGEFTEPVENCKVDYVSKTGQRIKYDYADLASVMRAIRPALSKNGLALTHLLSRVGINDILQTLLMHGESGQSLSSYYPLGNALLENPQTFGGKLSYARRYSVSALAGVSSESGNDLNDYDAVKRENAAPAKAAAPPPAKTAAGTRNEAPAGQAMLRAITAAASAKKVTEAELGHYFKWCYAGYSPSTLKKWQAEEILAFFEDPNTTPGQVMIAAEKAQNAALVKQSV